MRQGPAHRCGVGGTGGIVTRWDEELQVLVPVSASVPVPQSSRVHLGEGASGRAAQTRAPVLLNHGDSGAIEPILSQAHLESAVAVPLVHEARRSIQGRP